MKRIHFFQHVPFEASGMIDTWAQDRGFLSTTTRFFDGQKADMQDADWLVIMGGPMNIYEEDRHPWLAAEKTVIARAMAAGKTVLGICLGAQLIADLLGSRVRRGAHPEIGWFPVDKDPLADQTTVGRALPTRFDAFHWHGDTFDLPRGAVPLGSSEACACQGFVYDERVVALQFHLEFTVDRAAAVISNCGNEIGRGPYMQTAADMLAEPDRFDRLNELMATFLDGLAAVA